MSAKATQWKKSQGPQACIACIEDLKYGDLIYVDGAFALHATRKCVEIYQHDLKELGLSRPQR